MEGFIGMTYSYYRVTLLVVLLSLNFAMTSSIIAIQFK